MSYRVLIVLICTALFLNEKTVESVKHQDRAKAIKEQVENEKLPWKAGSNKKFENVDTKDYVKYVSKIKLDKKKFANIPEGPAEKTPVRGRLQEDSSANQQESRPKRQTNTCTCTCPTCPPCTSTTTLASTSTTAKPTTTTTTTKPTTTTTITTTTKPTTTTTILTIKTTTKPPTTTTPTIPTDFDYRTEAPECPSIAMIPNQGDCGSCWAISSASVITDRNCLLYDRNFYASAMQLVTCLYPNQGCDGGYPVEAMTYYNNTGLEEGTDPEFGIDGKCLPYDPNVSNSNKCPDECVNGDGMYVQSGDKRVYTYQASASFPIHDKMLKEIYFYGPAVSTFAVYESFFNYQEGIYTKLSTESGNTGLIGYHSVRIIGWGIENSTKYWLVANSWGKEWSSDGCFKILRGVNHCDIEDYVTCLDPY